MIKENFGFLTLRKDGMRMKRTKIKYVDRRKGKMVKGYAEMLF